MEWDQPKAPCCKASRAICVPDFGVGRESYHDPSVGVFSTKPPRNERGQKNVLGLLTAAIKKFRCDKRRRLFIYRR